MAKSSNPERKGLRNYIETVRSEISAVQARDNAKNTIAAMVDVFGLRVRARFDQLSAEDRATLEGIQREAEQLRAQAERKIDAVIEKRNRFKAKSALATEAHPDHADRNEDSSFSDDTRQEYAVFDGVGGHGDGDKASADAARVIKQKLAELGDDASIVDIKTKLLEAFALARQTINEATYNQAKHYDHRAGTTGVVAKIHRASDGKRTAVIAHAGDSRAYIRKKNGELKQVTMDHNLLRIHRANNKLTGDQVRYYNERFANVLDPYTELDQTTVLFRGLNPQTTNPQEYTEFDLFMECNAITNSVNSSELPTISELELEEGDQLLLTSDGIHDLVPDTNIKAAFDVQSDPDLIASKLLADSHAGIRKGPNGKSNDDRTALVVVWEDQFLAEVAKHKQRYREQLKKGEPFTPPLTDVDRDAFQQLIQEAPDGLEEAFIRHYNYTKRAYQAEWQAAGAGNWIEIVDMDEVYRKISTRALLGNGYDKLPGENDLEKKAFRLLLQKVDAMDFGRIIQKMTEHIQAGLDHGVNRADRFRGYHPDLDAALDAIAIPSSEELKGKLLKKIRGCYVNEQVGWSIVDTPEMRDAFGELRQGEEMTVRSGDYIVWIRNLARSRPENISFFQAVHPDLIDKLDDKPDRRSVRRKIVAAADTYFRVDTTVLYEAKLNILERAGNLTRAVADKERAAVGFTRTEGILADAELFKGLMALVAELIKDPKLTRDDIARLDACKQLAAKLLLTVEQVSEVVVMQAELLAEQAERRERAERRFVTELAKAATYMAGGFGLGLAAAAGTIALPVAAVPAVIAGVRLVDRLGTHGFRARKQSRYAQEAWSQLSTEQEALAKVAEADRDFSKSSGNLKAVFENIASGLAQLGQERIESKPNVELSELKGDLFWRVVQTRYPDEGNDYLDKKNAYETAVSQPATPPQELSYLFDEMMIAKDRLDDAAEGIWRVVDAQVALFDMEVQSAQQRDSEPSDAGWVERYPKLAAVLGYRNERASEKVASLAFFTAMGYASREFLPLRIAMGAFAGARGGEALALYLLQRFDREDDAKSEYRNLTAAALNAIDPTKPNEAKTKLIALENAVSENRVRLDDKKFRRTQAAQYEKLRALITRYDQLRIAVHAQMAINRLSIEINKKKEEQDFLSEKKTFEKFVRIMATAGGAILGASVMELLVAYTELQKAGFEQTEGTPSAPDANSTPDHPATEPPTGGTANEQPEASPAPETTNAAPSGNEPTPTSTTTEPVQPAAGGGSTTPAAETHPATPTGGEPTPTRAAPEPTTPAARGGGSTTPAPEHVPEPSAGSRVIGTAAELAHKVTEKLGLSHGLTGQGSRAEVTAGLLNTKVTLNGREIALMATGVRHADEVSPVLRADGHIDLYDVKDGHLITSGEMDKYLYVLKDGPGVGHSAGAHAAGAAIETPRGAGMPGALPGETPTGFGPSTPLPEGIMNTLEGGARSAAEHMPLPGESSADFIVRELRDYITTHPDAGYPSDTSNDDLLHNPLYESFRSQLEGRYRSAMGEGFSGSGGGGRDVIGASEGAPAGGAELGKELLNEAGKRLNEAGMELLGLAEHISPTGQIESYGEFSKKILQLLDMDQRERIIGPNGLVFEERGGQLYVDVAGGATEHFPLTQRLYEELMREWKTHVETGLDGKFDKESFFAAMDRAEAKHDLHPFELDRYDLQDMNKSDTYSGFIAELNRAMTTHGVERFTGGNALTFSRDAAGDYFVSYLTAKHELTPEFYSELMRTYNRLLPYEDGNFNSDAFHQVMEAVDGKR